MKRLKKILIRNLSNVPGWSTSRKIVVLESDDWGSTRMPSREVFDDLKRCGMPVQRSHYSLYDSLECNADLECLMYMLSQVYRSTGKKPVITTVNIVANPDYDRIKADHFENYYFETFNQTLKSYPEHDRVFGLWKQGISQGWFSPVFHGREHLNVRRWMRELQRGQRSVCLGFEHRISGIPGVGIDQEDIPDFQAAFDLDDMEDVEHQKNVLRDGLDLFELLFGYKSLCFVPTNGPFNNRLEQILAEKSVRFISTAKQQVEPLGMGRSRTNFRFLGSKNKLNQYYITRNSFFEPSASGFEYPENTDWISSCMSDIEIAFRWHKPAIISSHRVNYAGFLHPSNRDKNISLLQNLLLQIIKRWPDVEFLTTVELGRLIENRNS